MAPPRTSRRLLPIPREVRVPYVPYEDEDVPSEDVEHLEWVRTHISNADDTTSTAPRKRPFWRLYSEQALIMVGILAATAVLILVSVWVAKDNRQAPMVPFTPAEESSLRGYNSTTNDRPRFREPAFLEELRTVLNVTAEPETPQTIALAWMAADDLELWQYERLTLERLTQRYALAVFHIATGRWNQRGGWATPSGARIHECLWPGVFCDRNDAVRVLALNPSVGILQGSIPSEIGRLSGLEQLLLANNLLTNEIPDSIYSLSNLYSLQLANSSLSATLSPSIGKLTELLSLDVTNGGFSGKVPTELGSIPDLRRIYLAGNGFTGTIPSQLSRLSTLEKLYVEDTDLTGNVPAELCTLRFFRLNELHADCQTSVVCVPGCCTCY